MGLPVPNLDDRTFQDLVREARSMIPRYCPEWTDHNLSDPGITLIELFAWMVDILLYRLNKVPRKNYIKFLEMIGVKMAPASPATTDITFRLSAPQPAAMTIRAGTEAATLRTETEESIAFSTDTDLRIEVPTLSYFLITRDDVNFVDFLPELGRGKPIDLFREIPQEGNAFYLGFAEPLGGQHSFGNYGLRGSQGHRGYARRPAAGLGVLGRCHRRLAALREATGGSRLAGARWHGCPEPQGQHPAALAPHLLRHRGRLEEGVLGALPGCPTQTGAAVLPGITSSAGGGM